MFNSPARETLKELPSHNDIRREEGYGRSHVEVWPDAWVEWVSAHRRKRKGSDSREVCHLPGLGASPFCGLGYH